MTWGSSTATTSGISAPESDQGQDTPALGGAAFSEGAGLGQDRSLRAAVEQYLLQAVRDGLLKAGDRVLDTAIAQRLGISQTPVREAILRLTQDGIFEHQPRRGFFVAEFHSQQRDDLYLFRATIEGLAARLATTRITPAQLATLERLIEAGGQAARDGNQLANVEADAQFHSTIVEAAQHELVSRTWRSLAPLRWLPRLVSADLPAFTPDVAAVWVARHQHLVDVIRAGDPDITEAELRTHILRAGQVATAASNQRTKEETHAE